MTLNVQAPFVIIIILSWNGREDTLSCLASLREIHYPNRNIIVVDNGSTDGMAAAVRSGFPEVHVIETGVNLGFAGGNNVGIRYAIDHGADYVWLLNNDTLVDSHCLEEMVRVAEMDNRIGMVGGRICYLHDPLTLWYAGGTVDLEVGGVTRHVGKGCSDGSAYDFAVETGYITGCSLLARRQMLDEVGLLEEDYFLYFEDVDWSLRAKEKGWKLLYEPRAHVLHREGAQAGGIYSKHFVYYSIRNRLALMMRFAPRLMWRCHLVNVRMILYFVKNSLRFGLKSAMQTLYSAFQAYKDFSQGRMGYREKL